MEKVVIIGSGCAGYTAALYTARADLQPLVLTGKQPGGLLTTTSIVENFPGFPEGVDGYELMVRMQKQAEKFGARVQFGAVESADLSGTPFRLVVDGQPVETETLIIASGAGHRHLGLESEHLLENKGVTYCATCDGALPMFRNQPLVVVGGGDSAREEALYPDNSKLIYINNSWEASSCHRLEVYKGEERGAIFRQDIMNLIQSAAESLKKNLGLESNK